MGIALIKYPASGSELLVAISKLVNFPETDYRTRFEFQLPNIIYYKNDEIKGFCRKHRLWFVTRPRFLLGRSHALQAQTCPCCDFENGWRKNRPWTIWRVQQLLISINSSWTVKDFDPNEDRAIVNTERILLVCQFKDINDNLCIAPCGSTSSHTVRNLSTLQIDPTHIVCQGRCDQRAKGKSSRISALELQSRLAARNSSWRIIESGSERLADDYSAQCKICSLTLIAPGISISKEDPCCPLCSYFVGRLRLANPEFDLPRIISKISDSKVSLIDKDVSQFGKKTKLKVRCNLCNCEYVAYTYNLRKLLFSGCPTCKDCHNIKKGDTRLAQWAEKAKAAGLTILTPVWRGFEEKLELRCDACKFVFKRMPDKLSTNLSCPECSSKVGEFALRRILEVLLGKAFGDKMLIINGKKRIFDAYPVESEMDYGLPVVVAEYNGEQHRDPNHKLWFNDSKKYEKQKNSDDDKERWCRQHGIPFLVIWHLDFYRVPQKDRVKFVLDHLRKIGVEVPNPNATVDWAKIFRNAKGYNKLVEKVRGLGGEIIGQVTSYHLRAWFSCKFEEHEIFSLTPTRVLYQDAWCPTCTGRKPRR